GFFQPTAIAKWGATLDRVCGGRWAINVTSGWNMQEFDMYGIDKLDHDQRYRRSAEFIEVLRGAWHGQPYSYQGAYYQADNLHLEPFPENPLQVFQGGQSDAAIQMAAQHSDWMFLNGGDLERIEGIIQKVRAACRQTGREVRFAMYAAPLCRDTDAQAWDEIDRRLAQVDTDLVARRHARLSEGAQGMWGEADPLSVLDTNEGYAPRLIGSPERVLERIREYRALGIEMLHLDVSDPLFCTAVLPQLSDL
ncbi:MAG: LLM class flavin-dependent oxidoreductase, partial [Pseudomonadota bacterium]